MSKKVITAESKLLTRQTEQSEAVEKLPLTSPKKPKSKLKNYRLKETDLERLQKIIDGINELRPMDNPVTELAVIKALLLMGSRSKPVQMLKYVQESS